MTNRNDSAGAANLSPSKFWILGSRDGTNWFLVDSRSGIIWTSIGFTQTFTVSSGQAFTHFRVVCNSTAATSVFTVCIQQLVFNGTIDSVNVTADGRVGLGVVSPTRALEVAGDIVCSGTVSGGNPLMFRNALYNGDMRIAQRGTSFVGLNAYTLDRWYVSAQGALGAYYTVSQIASGLANFSSALQLQQTSTNVMNAFLSQSLETRDVVRFQGKSVTVSFWYRIPASFSGTWSAALNYNSSVDAPLYNYSVSYTNAASLNLTNQTAWTRVSITGPIPASAQALSVMFAITNSTTNSAQFQVTGVQLEKGTVATPFEVRPYATELALCQRYYTRFDSAGATSNYTRFGAGVVDSTTGAYTLLQLPVVMRAVPAFPGNATSNSAPSTFVLSIGGSNFTVTSMSSERTSSVVGMTWTGTGGVARAGALAIANNTTTAYLAYDAEL